MKILIAVHHFPPRYRGGGEWQAYHTAAGLQARGHQVRVVCIEEIRTGDGPALKWTDDIYEGIPVRRFSVHKSVTFGPFTWQYNNPVIGEHFRDLFAQDRPDIFHLISGYLISASPLLLAKELGIPTIVTLTDFWFLCPRFNMLRSDGKISTLPIHPEVCVRCMAEDRSLYHVPGKLFPNIMGEYWKRQIRRVDEMSVRSQFLKQALNDATAIISVSNFLKSMHIQAGIDPAKIIFSRQGCDQAEVALRDVEVKPHKPMIIGYTGQIAYLKGVHILVDAIRRSPDLPVGVKIYGNSQVFPRYTKKLHRMAKGDDRIEFMGPYDRRDIPQLLREVDLLVVPSLWYENSPTVILEAFAHHIPVITSNIGGMAELVQHMNNGLLFELGDPDQLAVQIRSLFEDPELYSNLCKGIKPVKSIVQEMDQLEDIYRGVVQDPQEIRMKM